MLLFYIMFWFIKDVLLCRVAILGFFKTKPEYEKKVLRSSISILILSQLIGALITILFYIIFIFDKQHLSYIGGALNASLFENQVVCLSGFLSAIIFSFLCLNFVLRKRNYISIGKVISLTFLCAPYFLLLPLVRMSEAIAILSALVGIVFIAPYYLFNLFSHLIFQYRKKKHPETFDYRIKASSDAFIAEIVGLVASIVFAIFLSNPDSSFPDNIISAFSFGITETHPFIIPLIGLCAAALCNFILLSVIDFKIYKRENRKYMADILLLTLCNAPYMFFLPIINIIAGIANLTTII